MTRRAAGLMSDFDDDVLATLKTPKTADQVRDSLGDGTTPIRQVQAALDDLVRNGLAKYEDRPHGLMAGVKERFYVAT